MLPEKMLGAKRATVSHEFAANKITTTKVSGGAISTKSASEADSSDQLSQIRLAIKKMTDRVYD